MDVWTDDGDDAEGLLVDMLKGLGVKVRPTHTALVLEHISLTELGP
jgi:hypothetical protein